VWYNAASIENYYYYQILIRMKRPNKKNKWYVAGSIKKYYH